VGKTLNGVAGLLRQALYSNELAGRPGVLQRIDARVKLIGALVLLVATAFVRDVPVLVMVYLVTLALAAISRLPLGFFLRRVWLFVPIFTGVVVLPAIFSFVTPGDVVASFGPFAITRQGLAGAVTIIARVATSISIVVLVTLTTPWTRILTALRSLRVPRIFVAILAMTYRYVFLLLGSVTDMYTARKARTVVVRADTTRDRAFVAASAGTLFGRTHALSEEVHQAMIARGYAGEQHALSTFRLRPFDLACLATTFVLAAFVIGVDRALA
jgi:cobalt ECF transporter T component CbiQ